jgi:hypothetical protein
MPRALARLGVDATDLRLVGLTLVVKVTLLVLGVAAVAAAGGQAANPLIPWDRWDAPHYTDLAVFGYGNTHEELVRAADGYRSIYPGELHLYIVFYPLYPWLVGALDAVLVEPVLSAFLVSGVASLFVAPLLRRLVGAELGDRIGVLSAWFLLVFPTAYFLHIGYTESLFLALALGSLLMARRGRWWTAGLLGALATLARVNGLVLAPALAVEAYLQWRADPAHRLRAGWLAIGGVAVGFGGYLALNLALYGDPMAWAAIQENHWGKSFAPPWVGIGRIFGWFATSEPDLVLMQGAMELGFVALGLAGTIGCAIWLRPTWTAWMAGNWLLVVSTGFVMSVPRYSLVLFPLFAIFAIASHERPIIGAMLSVASLALFVFFAVRFATGAWAF